LQVFVVNKLQLSRNCYFWIS